MPDEKRIERRWTPRWTYYAGKPGLAARLIPYCTMDGGPANKVHPPDEGEILMPVEEHQDALGEAQLQAAVLREEVKANFDGRTQERDRADVAVGKLESLRSGLKAEVCRLTNSALANGGGMEPYLDGCASTAIEASDRLQQLLDASEDTTNTQPPTRGGTSDEQHRAA